jgi:hypothetical protein
LSSPKGTGHWNTFDEDSVCIAAVLIEVAKYAPREGLLATIGMYLHEGLANRRAEYLDPSSRGDPHKRQKLEEENEKLRLIHAARAGKPNIYLGVSPPSVWDRKSERFLIVSKGIPKPPPRASIIILNLSEIFAMVRRSYEERPLK